MTRVRSVMAASMAAGPSSHPLNVGEDDSGYTKQLVVEKGLGAVMTSSPAPTPMERRTRCNEQVPFATPVANGAPT